MEQQIRAQGEAEIPHQAHRRLSGAPVGAGLNPSIIFLEPSAGVYVRRSITRAGEKHIFSGCPNIVPVRNDDSQKVSPMEPTQGVCPRGLLKGSVWGACPGDLSAGSAQGSCPGVLTMGSAQGRGAVQDSCLHTVHECCSKPPLGICPRRLGHCPLDTGSASTPDKASLPGLFSLRPAGNALRSHRFPEVQPFSRGTHIAQDRAMHTRTVSLQQKDAHRTGHHARTRGRSATGRLSSSPGIRCPPAPSMAVSSESPAWEASQPAIWSFYWALLGGHD